MIHWIQIAAAVVIVLFYSFDQIDHHKWESVIELLLLFFFFKFKTNRFNIYQSRYHDAMSTHPHTAWWSTIFFPTLCQFLLWCIFFSRACNMSYSIVIRSHHPLTRYTASRKTTHDNFNWKLLELFILAEWSQFFFGVLWTVDSFWFDSKMAQSKI